MAAAFREATFLAQDGLELYYRDYGDTGDGNPVALAPLLCLAGLTRNSADFHDFAQRHAAARRVLCLDNRGRGRSARDPRPENYLATTYVSDVGHLLAVTGCHKVIVVGTSLGGILAMILAVSKPAALAGVILNDIGPEVAAAGLARIAAHAGQPNRVRTMAEASEALKRSHGAAYPDWSDDDWMAEAERVYQVNDAGELERNYDPAIARSLSAPGQTADPWPVFRALADIPALCLRGDRSDILSSETLARMRLEKPDLMTAEIPGRGHVPTLGEPASIAAIEQFLHHCDGTAGS